MEENLFSYFSHIWGKVNGGYLNNVKIQNI